MAEKTYNNTLNEVEVSLGIERLLLADYPTTWTPARIDLSSLPSGFSDLGPVDEEGQDLKVSREKYELKTGLPKITQYQAIIGVTGTFSANLISNSWRKVQIAFGNYSAVSSATAVASISSVTSSGLIFTLSTTPTTPLAAGTQIIISAAGAQDAIDALEVRIASVTSNGLTYSCLTTPYALKTITTGHLVYVYQYVKQIIGGRSIRNYTLLGVADFIDGTQVIHHLKKCQVADDWNEKIAPSKAGMVPLSFNALGFTTTVGNCTETVVGERYYFPSGPGLCG